MAKLKLDLHDIYNKGGQIDSELKVFGHPPEARAKSIETDFTSMDDDEADQNVVLEHNSAD